MNNILDIIITFIHNNDLEKLAINSPIFYIRHIKIGNKLHNEYLLSKKNAHKLKYIKKLTIIELDDNIIPLFSKLVNVETLISQTNNISQYILDNFINLKELSLYDIRNPLNLNNLTKLELLVHISPVINNDNINKLKKLKYLFCSDNIDVTNFKNLEYLQIPLSNKINDLSKNIKLKHLTLLLFFDYQKDNCENIIKYNNIESLTITYDCDNSIITSGIDLEINNINKIKILHLKGKYYNFIKKIKFMENLEELTLEYCDENIDLNYNKKLRKIYVFNNKKITNESIENLENLEYCLFCNCPNIKNTKPFDNNFKLDNYNDNAKIYKKIK